MKILSVVGARPQFIKLAPVSSAMAEMGVDHVIVHTGQHYDPNMSRTFFDSLKIPVPDVNLEVGSGGHGAQTGRMMEALDPVLETHKPDWVLVYGDTNSTLAGAICATKLHLPLAHLEAGLRSFNRRMPEEHNRILADHAADLCLAPTSAAMTHLASEGLSERSVLVGDVMADVLLQVAASIENRPVPSPIPQSATDFVLATIHRPDNTDHVDRLQSILDALALLGPDVYLPMHPRLASRIEEFRLDPQERGIRTIEPLGYSQLVQALLSARAVVTDSGGLQKESYILGVPTTTVRTETEWVETLSGDWNVLSPEPECIPDLVARPQPPSERRMIFGDGRAASHAVRELLRQEPR